MSILIYEPDPLVCSDIHETLSEAFPQCTIDVLQAFDLSRLVDKIGEVALAVLSVTQDKLHRGLPDLRNLQAWFPVVLIVNDPPRPGHSQAESEFSYLPRPFSSETLIQKVNAALSARR